MKVLLLAYSISPIRGSEYSVGWNHVSHMSQYCDLTVLYGLAGPHMGDLTEMENYLRDHGEMPNVRFVPIRPNFIARMLNYPNRKGVLVYSFYIAYRIWHMQAARKAQELIAAETFDVVHYLCPIGYREPGFLWKIEKPYVWGPVGGLASTPLLNGAPRPPIATLKTRFKNLLNEIQLKTGRRVSRALVRADKVIAATSKNAEIFRTRFGIEAQHIPENAIPIDWEAGFTVSGDADVNSPLKIIWIGSLDYRKSPDLLVDAMARVKSGNWHLDIVGEGLLLDTIEAMVADEGLKGKVVFHGKISRNTVQDLLVESDLHVITSMNEANTTVIWEAMAAGVPTLTIDHCGMHDVVCNRCGIRIPLSDYQGTRDRIAAEIEKMIINRGTLVELAKGTLACRKDHMWHQRAQLWLDVYEQAIAQHTLSATRV